MIVAYVAGVATGWAARSMFGSTREAAVSAVKLALDLRARARRLAAQQAEFFEDVLAEAQARHGEAQAARGPRVAAVPRDAA
jgi:hypothetical protein